MREPSSEIDIENCPLSVEDVRAIVTSYRRPDNHSKASSQSNTIGVFEQSDLEQSDLEDPNTSLKSVNIIRLSNSQIFVQVSHDLFSGTTINIPQKYAEELEPKIISLKGLLSRKTLQPNPKDIWLETEPPSHFSGDMATYFALHNNYLKDSSGQKQTPEKHRIHFLKATVSDLRKRLETPTSSPLTRTLEQEGYIEADTPLTVKDVNLFVARYPSENISLGKAYELNDSKESSSTIDLPDTGVQFHLVHLSDGQFIALKITYQQNKPPSLIIIDPRSEIESTSKAKKNLIDSVNILIKNEKLVPDSAPPINPTYQYLNLQQSFKNYSADMLIACIVKKESIKKTDITETKLQNYRSDIIKTLVNEDYYKQGKQYTTLGERYYHNIASEKKLNAYFSEKEKTCETYLTNQAKILFNPLVAPSRPESTSTTCDDGLYTDQLLEHAKHTQKPPTNIANYDTQLKKLTDQKIKLRSCEQKDNIYKKTYILEQGTADEQEITLEHSLIKSNGKLVRNIAVADSDKNKLSFDDQYKLLALETKAMALQLYGEEYFTDGNHPSVYVDPKSIPSDYRNTFKEEIEKSGFALKIVKIKPSRPKKSPLAPKGNGLFGQSKEKQQAPRVVCLASDSGQKYKVKEIKGNGDCGYTAIGLTRIKAAEILKTHYNKPNYAKLAQIKEHLGKALGDVLLENEFFKYAKTKQAIPQTLDIRALDTTATKKAYMAKDEVINCYLDYVVRDGNIHGGWPHIHELAALAIIKNIALKVFKENDSGDITPHNPGNNPDYDFSNFNSGATGGCKEILFSKNTNHFDLLEKITVSSQQQSENTNPSVPPASLHS